jgi:hypothetical protein
MRPHFVAYSVRAVAGEAPLGDDSVMGRRGLIGLFASPSK